jgi:hypothetical protein
MDTGFETPEKYDRPVRKKVTTLSLLVNYSGEIKMVILKLLIGIFLLIFGRKLFWLLVGGIGFFAGSYLASFLFQGSSEVVSILFALVIGFIGAMLAQFVQKVGIGLAGFVIGGMVFSGFLSAVLVSVDIPQWVFFLVGGGLGVLLTVVLFEWSLIVFSSLTGAWMITQAMNMSFLASAIIFVVLILGGLTLQFRMNREKN